MTARTTARAPQMRKCLAHSFTRAPSDGSTSHVMRMDRPMIPHDTYQPRWASSSRGISVSRHPLPPLPVVVGEPEGCAGKPAVQRSVALILALAGMHVKQKVRVILRYGWNLRCDGRVHLTYRCQRSKLVPTRAAGEVGGAARQSSPEAGEIKS
jgi:hypothetical protein